MKKNKAGLGVHTEFTTPTPAVLSQEKDIGTKSRFKANIAQAGEAAGQVGFCFCERPATR